MNKNCMFFKSDRCSILKFTKCNEFCKFKKTPEEFIEAQEKAARMLKSKGLRSCEKKVGNETIITTRRIDDESKSN